jgi:peptide chain release factor 2
LAAQPDFWDDQTQAQDILQELSDCKASLAQLQEWQTGLEDTDAILELLQEDSDEALLQEAQSTVAKLSQDLDQWELQQLLSGPYDKRGAVLTINAGAGGPMPRTGLKCC